MPHSYYICTCTLISYAWALSYRTTSNIVCTTWAYIVFTTNKLRHRSQQQIEATDGGPCSALSPIPLLFAWKYSVQILLDYPHSSHPVYQYGVRNSYGIIPKDIMYRIYIEIVECFVAMLCDAHPTITHTHSHIHTSKSICMSVNMCMALIDTLLPFN